MISDSNKKHRTIKAVVFSTLVTAIALTTSASAFAVEAARSTMESKLSVPQTCRVTSVQDVDFGVYTGAQVRKTMVVGFRCNKVTPYIAMAIKMDCGKNGSEVSGVCARKMKNTNENFSSSVLNYEIYTDSGYASKLNSDGQKYNYNLPGSVYTHTFYNQVPASQFTAAYGSYADDVTVTIAF